MTEPPSSTRGLLSPRRGWLRAQLTSIRTETWSSRSLTFEVPGWRGHLAGQHIDVRLTAADGYTAQRAYSISAPPSGQQVSITVQQVEEGEVSPYLVQEMTLGDVLEVRGPIGGWFVWSPDTEAPVEPPVLLVGGGSGIVPLMAMVRERARTGSETPFRLVYSVRDDDQVIYADELRDRSANGELALTLLHTREAPEGTTRPVGRIADADLATPSELGWPDYVPARAYVCGPTGFVEHAIARLLDLGHTNRTIRAERFGPTGG